MRYVEWYVTTRRTPEHRHGCYDWTGVSTGTVMNTPHFLSWARGGWGVPPTTGAAGSYQNLKLVTEATDRWGGDGVGLATLWKWDRLAEF